MKIGNLSDQDVLDGVHIARQMASALRESVNGLAFDGMQSFLIMIVAAKDKELAYDTMHMPIRDDMRLEIAMIEAGAAVARQQPMVILNVTAVVNSLEKDNTIQVHSASYRGKAGLATLHVNRLKRGLWHMLDDEIVATPVEYGPATFFFHSYTAVVDLGWVVAEIQRLTRNESLREQ